MKPSKARAGLLTEPVQRLRETASRPGRSDPAAAAARVPSLALVCLLLLGAVASPGLLAAQPVGPLPPPPAASELSRGKLLVAHPKIQDPRFLQSVILIVDYNPTSTLGLIINQPTNAKLHALLPQLTRPGQENDTLYNGGPVGRSGLLVLLGAKDPIEGSRPVAEGIYVSGSLEVLTKLLGGETKVDIFRVYAGYAGWAPGQLENELRRGDWYVVPAEAKTVFDENPARVWPDIMRRLTAHWVAAPPALRGARIETKPPARAAMPWVRLFRALSASRAAFRR